MFATELDGDALSELQYCSARSFAKGEDVKVGDGKALDKGKDFFEFVVVLAVEASHDIGGDACIGHFFFDVMKQVGVETGVVTSTHELKYFVASGLEWDMEVREEVARGGDEVDDVGCKQVGFDTGDAVAFDAIELVELLEEFEEAFAMLLSEGACIDAGQHDFFGAGGGYFTSHGDGVLNGGATRATASIRDGAVGAEVVATVLDFEESASTVGMRVCQMKFLWFAGFLGEFSFKKTLNVFQKVVFLVVA